MKIRKRYFNKCNTTIVDIERIRISYDNIIKILDSFQFKEVIIIVDAIKKNSDIYKILNENEVRFSALNITNYDYEQIVLMLNLDDLHIISELIKLEADLYLFDKDNKKEFEHYVYNFNYMPDKIIKNENYEFIMDIVFNEQYINIYLNTKKYEVDSIIRKLKEIF